MVDVCLATPEEPVVRTPRLAALRSLVKKDDRLCRELSMDRPSALPGHPRHRISRNVDATRGAGHQACCPASVRIAAARTGRMWTGAATTRPAGLGHTCGRHRPTIVVR